VVQLPESGEIVHYLLTFIFPVTPLVPSTPEEIMELLSVAHKYQMENALSHIRGIIARQNSLPTGLEPALRIYSLAQKYGLRPEALQTARTILNYPMTTEAFDNMLDIPGTSLYELWKYYERVRAILVSGRTEYTSKARARGVKGLRCTSTSSSKMPKWLDQYIQSIGKSPNLFDSAELSSAIARHIADFASAGNRCECFFISSQTTRNIWDALASVVRGSFEKASMVDVQSYRANWNFKCSTGRVGSISRAGSRKFTGPNQFDHISNRTIGRTRRQSYNPIIRPC
jgi:hypothetical protein